MMMKCAVSRMNLGH